MRLQGKVAIVTGGGQGIGEGIAHLFAREGAAVVVTARSVHKLEDVAAAIRSEGGRALAVPADIRQEADIARLVERTIAEYGRLDTLVNNAGVPWFGHSMAEDTAHSLPAYEDIQNTNVRGSWLAIHYALPHMQAVGGGSIINISSVHGRVGAAFGSAYAASKGAIDAMTRSLAIELAPWGIRVNSVAPGAINVSKSTLAEALRKLGEQEKAAALEAALERNYQFTQPIRRMGLPEDVGWACVYLAADESRFVTGTTLMVDGGSTALLGEPSRFTRETWQALEEWRAIVSEARRIVNAAEKRGTQ